MIKNFNKLSTSQKKINSSQTFHSIYKIFDDIKTDIYTPKKDRSIRKKSIAQNKTDVAKHTFQSTRTEI